MKKLMMIVAMAAVIGMAGTAEAGLSLWLDADAIGVVPTGTTVATWSDLSGNNNHAAATGTPSYEVNQFNGGTMPGVYLDPVTASTDDGDYYTVADAPSLDLPVDHSFFAVIKMAGDVSASGMSGLLTKVDGSAGYFPGYRHAIAASGAHYLQAMVGDATTSAYRNPNGQNNPIGTPAIVGATRDAPIAGQLQLETYRNGTAAASYSGFESGNANGSVANDADLVIGRMHLPPSTDPRELDAYIGEYILFDELLTSQQILDINAYLGAKWGITVEGGGNAAAGRALLPAAGPVIPEPAGLGLIGLALLAVRRRRS